MGAYLRLVTPGVPILGAFMYNAIYKIPAYRFVCDGVFTTKTPTDAYRGAGRPEATFAIERIVDEMAVELGMDPMELRRKNWIKHEEFPFTTVAGLTYDSGNYEAATERALELIGWDELKREQARTPLVERPGAAGPRHLDVHRDVRAGALAGAGRALPTPPAAGRTPSVRMLATGKVEVVTGSSAHGQGHETAWSQIVADQLGVPFDDIEIIHGDTQSSPQGHGHLRVAIADRRRHRRGRAPPQKVIAKARKVAAHMLEASEDDLEFADGTFSVRGAPGTGKTIQDVAFATFAAHDLPDGIEPSLDADATYDPENFSFPHGTHLCAVDVDTETGRAKIRKYVCVDDIGEVDQPADRRGPGARRPRAGHRPGAVRGGASTTRKAT